MKAWLKGALGIVIVALLAAGIWRTLAARNNKQAALAAQQQAQKAPVALALRPADLVTVKAVDLPLTLALSGTVKATHTAFVKARIPGELQGLQVREGDAVKLGQVLGRIDPQESAARLTQSQSQAQAARAQVDIARRSFDNSRALVSQGFISSTALETAQANLAAAQANLAAAQASGDLAAKSLDDTVLRAPISGQVSQRLVQSGERLAVDTRVLEIVDLNHLELEAALSSADALRVRVGQTAQLFLDGGAPAASARVVRINPSASVGSRAVLVYLSITPGSGLRHGAFAQGLLTTGSRRVLALPLSTVRTDKPEPYVQLLLQNQVVHMPVVIGLRGEMAGQTMVAIEGVPDGGVALSGSLGALRAGTPVIQTSNASGTP